MHGITEQQWLAFSEGAAGEAECNRIQNHLSECGECSRLYEQLTNWHETLATEGAKLRESLALPDAALQRMLAESLTRVSRVGKPEPGNAIEAIAALRGLLGPVFGAGTVRGDD